MMTLSRLGLRGRLILIVVASLLAVSMAEIAIRSREIHEALPSVHVPYPRIEQAAGIIDLVRDTDQSLWPTVLRAASGANLRAYIVDRPPPENDRLRRAPLIEGVLREHTAGDIGPGLRAYTDIDIPLKTAGTEGLPARVVWPISDGRVLVLDTTTFPAVPPGRFLGLTAGMWIGITGFVVAALALLTTARELRPLRLLTRAAIDFDGMPPVAIPERGAHDVKRLIRAVSDMQRRLAVLLQERSFIIGAISHDLRTYLTRLRLRVEGLADPEQRTRAAGDLDAMTDLIDTALAFARGTASNERRHLVDLADLVAIEAAERSALGQTIAVGKEDTADAFVLGDPVALRRVVANLVDNALKFGRGQVAVALETDARTFRVVVDDDGPGVTETQRSAIFSPFYRVEGSRSRGTGGSGLGLAIARQIVEAHGGTITVGDSPIGGARFAVILPRVRA